MGAFRSLLLPSLPLLLLLSSLVGCRSEATQRPLLRRSGNATLIPEPLFWELEQLARIVDISYCVGTAGLGIQKPFSCASRCGDPDLESFELIVAWNTGPFLSDSCGYIALDHSPANPRLILAFRGTYSIANTIADLSTIPQEYVPYPGHDDDDESDKPKHSAQEHGPPAADPPKCENCTVHSGFHSSWLNARKVILPHVTQALEKHPTYKLVLVGHSLGGAVATLAGLDFKARGWDPRVTTFGEPKVGNKALNKYINHRFNISPHHERNKFHRVTHAGDPVPLLPLDEWGYSMHSEEIFASQSSIPYSTDQVWYCQGDDDSNCIAGSDKDKPIWGLPTRFKFWQLFFAHRDYFWRLGLCIPGGDPKDWWSKYPSHRMGNEKDKATEVDEL